MAPGRLRVPPDSKSPCVRAECGRHTLHCNKCSPPGHLILLPTTIRSQPVEVIHVDGVVVGIDPHGSITHGRFAGGVMTEGPPVVLHGVQKHVPLAFAAHILQVPPGPPPQQP